MQVRQPGTVNGVMQINFQPEPGHAYYLIGNVGFLQCVCESTRGVSALPTVAAQQNSAAGTRRKAPAAMNSLGAHASPRSDLLRGLNLIDGGSSEKFRRTMPTTINQRAFLRVLRAQFAADRVRNARRKVLDLFEVGAFHHDTRQRLGTGEANQYPARAGKLLFC